MDWIKGLAAFLLIGAFAMTLANDLFHPELYNSSKSHDKDVAAPFAFTNQAQFIQIDLTDFGCTDPCHSGAQHLGHTNFLIHSNEQRCLVAIKPRKHDSFGNRLTEGPIPECPRRPPKIFSLLDNALDLGLA